MYDTGYHKDDNPIEHKCNIWDIVKISDTQVIYLCSVCKKKVAISDKDLYGIDLIITIIDLGEGKIYPEKEQQKISEENLDEWK